MRKIILLMVIPFFSLAVNVQGQAKNGLLLKAADSLFGIKEWKAAKANYVRYLKDTSKNALAWNRLGYCNHNLGKYDEAMADYERALDNKPNPPLRSVLSERIARVYSLTGKTDSVSGWLVKTAALGYNVLADLDTMADFKNVRKAGNFADIRKVVYGTVYPCAVEARAHDFDFWIGEWEVYQTGSKFLVGHSLVQSISGGCALLENWTSTQASTGKSVNYYNTATGKWEQDWIGSAGGPQRYLDGVYKDSAMQFTYEFTNGQGKKQTGNFKFYNIDKDTVRQYQDINNDDGKTVTVSYDFTYVRKKQ
jgi:tetratricopeptide (TPR) repeat protein